MIKLKNSDKAIKRLILALKNGEKIGVWSDYDPDGVFALVLAYEAFLNAGFANKNLKLILPNQDQFGRSLNTFHLSILKKIGIKLIVGIDFGTTDFNIVRTAKKMGFEIIFLDHHRQRPGKLLATLVNPWQKGDNANNRNWSGTGVAYLFFENLYKELNIDIEKLEGSLDLLLIPALADYIPIDKLNLPYLKRSLDKIKNNKRSGIYLGLKELKISKNITIEKMVKERVNIINFFGSLRGNNENANVFKLLISKDKKEVADIIKEIKKQKKNFENFVKKMTTIGIKKFRSSDRAKKDGFILWGIDKKLEMTGSGSKVSHQLNDYFKVPCFFYNKERNYLKGSVRSMHSDTSIIEVLDICKDILINYGGHPKAAGFHLKKKDLPIFKKCLEKYYSNN
jgi:single-stranded-DNA-specific exonuclease